MDINIDAVTGGAILLNGIIRHVVFDPVEAAIRSATDDATRTPLLFITEQLVEAAASQSSDRTTFNAVRAVIRQPDNSRE
jgi:hypothetical protein